MMYTYAATFIRAVDGDTVRLVLDLGFRLTRREEPYRLLRIDAPEINTEPGKASRDWLTMFLSNKVLTAQTFKSDSFGRWLVELVADGESVSDAAVAAGMATYRTY